MIKPTSIAYPVAVYDAKVRDLNSDGTPKTEDFRHLTTLMQFPEAVQNRVRAMTENRRFRNFVFGMPFSFHGIDKAWLYICFEKPVQYQVMANVRERSGLSIDQCGFFTFDEGSLETFFDGGRSPEVNVVCFSGIHEAMRAMRFLGAPELIDDLGLQPDTSYFMFAQYELAINIEAATRFG